MRGGKRERSPGVWELRVYLGRDPITGKPRQKSRTFRGGKRAADDALRAFATEQEAHRSPATEGTFGFLLDQWLRHSAKHHALTTQEEYERIVRVRLVPALGAVELRKLKGPMFDALYDAMQEEGRAPATINQVHAVARKALNFGVKQGWLNRNPAMDAEPPAVVQKEVSPPEVPELLEIVKAAASRDGDYGILLTLKAALGCRRGEICGLRWSDIDLQTGRVAIKRAVVSVKGDQLHVKATTKTNQNRRLLIDAPTLDVMQRYRALVLERAAAESPTGKLRRDAFVFSRTPDGGTPYRPDLLSIMFRRAADSVGSTAVLHDLRHLNASLLLAAGVPLHTVQRRLGHAKASTTLDIYGHAMPADDQVAAGVLGQLLAGPSTVQRALNTEQGAG